MKALIFGFLAFGGLILSCASVHAQSTDTTTKKEYVCEQGSIDLITLDIPVTMYALHAQAVFIPITSGKLLVGYKTPVSNYVHALACHSFRLARSGLSCS